VPVHDIAKLVNRSDRAIYELARRKKVPFRRGYTETELYILENFPLGAVAGIITDKSANALKLKRWRMKKSVKTSAC